jgi:hypothetical protein
MEVKQFELIRRNSKEIERGRFYEFILERVRL